MRQINVALVLLFVSSPAFAQAAGAGSATADSFADTFSQTLLKVVEASESGFRSIKGPSNPASNGEAWFSTLSLPTARECVVWIYRDHSLGRQYSCDFGRTFDLGEAQKGYEQALKVVTQSLAGWSKSENARRSSKIISKAEFSRGSSGPSVILRLVNHGVHGYLLYVDVNPSE
ncbi:MAG TPA: hypothetical protein VE377_15955 [Candidatus Dormibacteraeota bacterium]|nr:hypothetical protein [Candidatus Dormibacteraeota bacterium]